MRKRFSRSILNKITGHEPNRHEVAGSHAYGSVARNSPSIPSARRSSPADRRAVARYRDSMVGSTIQYRDKLPAARKESPTQNQTPSGEGIIGNRPKSSTADKRHHFNEPPKRSFNPYD